MAQPTSIHRITTRYLAFTIALTLMGIVIIFSSTYGHLEAEKQESLQQQQQLIAENVAHLIAFYDGIVDSVARQAEPYDLIAFADHDEAEAWAREFRRLLPDAIGVALVDNELGVLGEPLQLRLGNQCVLDVAALLDGSAVSPTPVHHEVAGMEHFDVTARIGQGGETAGLLFVSFRLEVVKDLLASMLQSNERVQIVDGSGFTVADVGELDHTVEAVINFSGKVDGTDWTLYYSRPESGKQTIVVTVLVVGGLVLLGFSLMNLVMSLHLGRVVSSELSHIQQELEAVNSGERERIGRADFQLMETQSIMQSIWQLMGQIEATRNQLKAQSQTDELTRLFNRRHFRHHLKQEWGLARRGIDACLILLDLDRFKQVNDQFGHGIGDEVLKAFADALRSRVRMTDYAARLGGDEFAVIQVGSRCEAMTSWYEGLREQFLHNVRLIAERENIVIDCGVSAGAMSFDVSRYADSKQMLDAADQQLYQAKKQGRGCIACNE